MKISCVQMDMKLGSPDENFVKAEQLIRSASKEKPDVIVLPETWNVGFFPKDNLKELCDVNGERTKTLMIALAKELDVNIVSGSVATLRDGRVYNTAYVFTRGGECVAQYDKTHLFTPMHEDDYFEKGGHRTTFMLDGKRCGIIICYDIRFPELTRSMTVDGIDILFVVSQWPSVRVPHLNALTKARSIENQMFTVCCNSCGTADATVYGGNSSIHDPWGEVLAHAGGNEQIITAECDTNILKGIRETINVFADRRVELYKY